jgi:hypothetical protein
VLEELEAVDEVVVLLLGDAVVVVVVVVFNVLGATFT